MFSVLVRYVILTVSVFHSPNLLICDVFLSNLLSETDCYTCCFCILSVVPCNGFLRLCQAAQAAFSQEAVQLNLGK